MEQGAAKKMWDGRRRRPKYVANDQPWIFGWYPIFRQTTIGSQTWVTTAFWYKTQNTHNCIIMTLTNCSQRRFHSILTCIDIDVLVTELDDGKIYRKPLYLMVKTMVSCRFSLKPIHWFSRVPVRPELHHITPVCAEYRWLLFCWCWHH